MAKQINEFPVALELSPLNRIPVEQYIGGNWLTKYFTPAQFEKDALRTFTPEQFGGVADGGEVSRTDNASALQNAVNACQAVQGVLKFSGLYATSVAIVISDSMTLIGESGPFPTYGFKESFDPLGGEIPSVSPYVNGCGIVPTTAGQNGFTITAIGRAVNVVNILVKFAEDIKFKTTGHGFYCVPPVDGIRQTGMFDPIWSNAMVYGHDGNHYAFYIVNSINGQFDHLRGFGGGGLFFEADANFAGNVLFNFPYFAVFVGGTAHGYAFSAINAGTNNFLMFNLPQCNMHNTAHIPTLDLGVGVAQCVGTQYLVKMYDTFGPSTWLGTIMEGYVGGADPETAGILFPADMGINTWVSQIPPEGQPSAGTGHFAGTAFHGALSVAGAIGEVLYTGRDNAGHAMHQYVIGGLFQHLAVLPGGTLVTFTTDGANARDFIKRSVQQDQAIASADDCQLKVRGSTLPVKMLAFGYDTTLNEGIIQATWHLSATQPLRLQKYGSGVVIGQGVIADPGNDNFHVVGQARIGTLKFNTLPPIYANNAAAITGGLVAGQTYRTGGDPDLLCQVH